MEMRFARLSFLPLPMPHSSNLFKRPVRWVALAGFMGTGKSRVGWELARALDLYFFDTDKAIERMVHLSVPQFFEEYGEAAFREYEHQLLEKVAQLEKTVVSLGGGSFVSPHNQQILKARGPIVVLEARPETIFERTHRSNRPLLRGENPLERIRELLEARRESYAQGDIFVSTDGRESGKVVAEIVERLWEWRKARDAETGRIKVE